jgi:hypothetical protein
MQIPCSAPPVTTVFTNDADTPAFTCTQDMASVGPTVQP